MAQPGSTLLDKTCARDNVSLSTTFHISFNISFIFLIIIIMGANRSEDPVRLEALKWQRIHPPSSLELHTCFWLRSFTVHYWDYFWQTFVSLKNYKLQNVLQREYHQDHQLAQRVGERRTQYFKILCCQQLHKLR